MYFTREPTRYKNVLNNFYYFSKEQQPFAKEYN